MHLKYNGALIFNNSAAQRLSTQTISAGHVLDSESRMWLKAIYKRLAGAVGIRRPYYGEITRCIPYDIFTTARQVLRDFDCQEPDVYIKGNRKGEVISFTSFHLLQKFLSCLSGISVSEVKKFFTRKLIKGNRHNHKVKVIITKQKDFGIVYKKNIGQLSIQFHFGEWNIYGNPQHCT